MEREAAMAAPPLRITQQWCLASIAVWVFLHKHSRLWISSLPSPQTVSLQPTAVLPAGLLSNQHVPAPNPHVHWQTHIPVCSMQGCGMDRLCRSRSVLSVTDWPFHPPLTTSDTPLLSQLISPSMRGLPWMREPLLCFSSLREVQSWSNFLSSSFPLLSFVLPSYVGIFLVLSGVHGLLLVFSWCSVRIVPSVDVFLMHLWREMSYTPSYSSTILVSLFSLLKWCITLVDFQILNPGIPGIKSHLIMVYDPFHAWLNFMHSLLIFCWEFLHLCS